MRKYREEREGGQPTGLVFKTQCDLGTPGAIRIYCVKRFASQVRLGSAVRIREGGRATPRTSPGFWGSEAQGNCTSEGSGEANLRDGGRRRKTREMDLKCRYIKTTPAVHEIGRISQRTNFKGVGSAGQERGSLSSGFPEQGCGTSYSGSRIAPRTCQEPPQCPPWAIV